MGYLQTMLFLRDFNSEKCTDCNFTVSFLNFFDIGVNSCGNFLSFCRSWKTPQKSQKLEPAKI